MTKRRPLTRKQIRMLMKRQAPTRTSMPTCAVHGCPVMLTGGLGNGPKNWVDEHIIPLAIGGTNALKNRELRCIQHAKEKTFKPTMAGSDVQKIAKMRRCRKKLIVHKPPPGTVDELRNRFDTYEPKKTRKHKWVSRPLKGRGFEKAKRPMVGKKKGASRLR